MKCLRWRQRKEEGLEAEIQSHLDLATRDRNERGGTTEQARANVLREFGHVGLVKEVTVRCGAGLRSNDWGRTYGLACGC